MPNVTYAMGCVVCDDATVWIYRCCADAFLGPTAVRLDEIIALARKNSF